MNRYRLIGSPSRRKPPPASGCPARREAPALHAATAAAPRAPQSSARPCRRHPPPPARPSGAPPSRSVHLPTDRRDGPVTLSHQGNDLRLERRRERSPWSATCSLALHLLPHPNTLLVGSRPHLRCSPVRGKSSAPRGAAAPRCHAETGKAPINPYRRTCPAAQAPQQSHRCHTSPECNRHFSLTASVPTD